MATKQPFKMNLQLFADTDPTPQPSQADLAAQAMAILQSGAQPTEGAAPQQGQPNQAEGNPQPSSQEGGQMHQGMSQMGNMPMEQQSGQQPNQEGAQGQPQQQAPNSDQMLLGKFRSPEELANGYVNVERAYSQKAQELAAKNQELAAMQQQMQQMQQQIQSVVNPQQQQPQPTPEELNEQFMNQFYENPTQSIQQMVQQAIENSIMPQIAPMKQQFQQQQLANARNMATQQFAQATPDFEQFKPVMAQILSSNDALNQMDPSQAIQIAYQMAKGQQYQDPNALLQNQDFVKNNVLSNQDIKNQVIQEYLQSLKQNNQAPTVIAGQVNGATPVVPENRPRNMDEAKAMAMKLMQG